MGNMGPLCVLVTTVFSEDTTYYSIRLRYYLLQYSVKILLTTESSHELPGAVPDGRAQARVKHVRDGGAPPRLNVINVVNYLRDISRYKPSLTTGNYNPQGKHF